MDKYFNSKFVHNKKLNNFIDFLWSAHCKELIAGIVGWTPGKVKKFVFLLQIIFVNALIRTLLKTLYRLCMSYDSWTLIFINLVKSEINWADVLCLFISISFIHLFIVYWRGYVYAKQQINVPVIPFFLTATYTKEAKLKIGRRQNWNLKNMNVWAVLNVENDGEGGSFL